jgi:hypothetical protein
MKVFFSWQSDTPARIGRNFLRDALKEAVEQLKVTASVEEAQRLARSSQPGEEQGASANPGELKELLKSIGEAATVVADVTALGQSLKSVDNPEASAVRKFVDSDVAFEAGYASHLLGERKVVLLFNAHYGWHDDMPVNLRNRGGAIAFTLVPNAARPEIEAERKRLVAKLLTALGQSLNTPPSAVGGAGLPSNGGNRGAYFRPGEVMARSGKQGPGEISYTYAADTLCYLRLIPLPPLERPLPLAGLRKVVERAPLLSRQPEGALGGRNDYGAIAFEPSSPPSRGPGNLSASTQLFITGEIWSIGNSLIARERGERPQWIKLPFLSSVIFERVYYDQLRALTQFALEQLSLSAPWEVECGVAGSKGLHLWVSAQETSGPIVQADVITRRRMKTGSEAEIDAILLEFFNLLHAAAGSERPKGLHGFPPGRPR